MASQVVILRVIHMPCCHHQVCWVNPRLPNYCPECGVFIFEKVRAGIMAQYDNALLHFQEDT